MPTIHLLIKGKVQGVFYRVSAKEKADEIGIYGWVKNNKDGGVEAVASGTDKQLELFIDWCKRGPGKAMVDFVQVSPLPDTFFKRFEIVR